MKNIFTIIFITVFSMLTHHGTAQCNFFIPDFNNFNTVGNTTIGGGGCYTLTTGYANGGAAWYRDSANLGYDFDLSFNTYQCGSADGMMFVMQSCSNGATAIGNSGSSLGYYQGTSFNHSLGVEMDIYNSGSSAPYYDPDNSHIAVVKNDTATPLAGPVNISPYLGDCSTRVLRVTWNATTHLFSVYLNGGLITSYNDDLVTDVFAGNPHVYFGFTAACGGYWATQSFCVNYLHYTPSHVHTTTLTINNNSGVACTGGTLTASAGAVSYVWSTSETTNSIVATAQGDYTVTATAYGGCTASATFSVTPAPGDTSVFGNHVWNVYAFNAGGQIDSGKSWKNAYSGYYVDTNLNFNTESRWNIGSSPSAASGYNGCVVNNENHSWSAKREGFPCGIYQIDIPSHDDEAQLFVNGTKVWEHIGCCDSHTNVWTGFLDDNSTVVFRTTEGAGSSFGAVNVVPQNSISVSGPTTICPGYSLQLTANSADSYLWSTGETTQSISVNATGNYSVDATMNGCTRTASQTITVTPLDTAVIHSSGLTYCPVNGYVNLSTDYNSRYSSLSWSNGATYYYTSVNYAGNISLTVSDALGCSATSHAVVTGPPGDEGTFGDNVWKVNGYYDGYSYYYYYYYSSGSPWVESNYSGYYIDTTLNFNTENKWSRNSSPSSATGYQGCNISSDYFSFNAKRQGFDCGIYQIDIPGHDDNAQLWIDGAMVWEHTGCCDAHTNVWTGVLNSDSRVEFKVQELGGSAFGSLQFITIQSFTPTTPTISGGTEICGSNPLTLDAGTGFTNYTWSTGSTTQAISTSTAGDYSVKVTDGNGCVSSAQTSLTSLVQYTYYADGDADTYGNPANSTAVCSSAPSGYVSNNTDCNDASASVHPGASDVCNSIDDNCNGVVDENAISATITPGGNFSFCTGTTVILVANSGSGLTYQWVKNGKSISGAVQHTYSTKKPANYQVKETNSFGCSSTSATTTLTQVNKPTASITAQGSLDICGTNSVILQANAGTGLLYQWVKNAGYITGATNQSYTAIAKGNYKCIVSNSAGCSSTSSALKVTKSCKANVDDLVASSMQLYPNPNSGNFVIELTLSDNSSSSADIQILNMLGQVMYTNSSTIVDGELKLDIQLDPNIPSGNYFVRVIVSEEVFTQQIVVQQ